MLRSVPARFSAIGGRTIAYAFPVSRVLATAVTAIVFLLAWRHDPRRPTSLSPGDGWWSNYDQNHYLLSALAFAHGDLSPAAHWYLPAYPALASLFVRLLPADPFMPVDLACLLVSLHLSAGLGAALSPRWRLGGAAGLAAFLACVVLPPVSLQAWVMPWTSTLAVPLMLGSLRATLAGLSRPDRRWPPLLAGMTGAAVAGCRPIDAVLLLGCVGLVGGVAAIRAGGISHASRHWLALFVLGVACGALPNLVLYLLIWGPHESAYMTSSALVGFDRRLLPLHWVELMISPRPLLPGGVGLVQRLPFIGVGLIGVAAALLACTADRLRHALVALTLGSSIALYLCYRDLHAPGLWTFSNYHYFKWSFAVLGYYALLLLRLVVRARGPRLVWLVPIAAALFGWHVVPHRDGVVVGTRRDDRSITMPVPPLGVTDAVVLPAVGPFEPIYFGSHDVSISGQPLPPISHFKALPIEGGLMITPLRPWPAGTLSVHLVEGIKLGNAPAPFLARVTLRPGLPCWFGWRQRGCDADGLLPPTLVSPGTPVGLDGDNAPQLGPGWSFQEPTGRWTLGRAAELRFRIDPADKGPVLVTLSASPIWLPGMPPARLHLAAGGQPPVLRLLPDGATRDISVPVPAAARAADGTVELWIDIARPHPPSELFPGSRDTRPIGLFVRSLRWTDIAP